MHLLLTAFWHQHSKFQGAQKGAWAASSMARGIRSQTQPAPWFTMQRLTSTAGQTSARCLLPNGPTNKSHQSDENLCFRCCWIMQEHNFFFFLPESQSYYGLILGLCLPDCLWVHTQLCVIPVSVHKQLQSGQMQSSESHMCSGIHMKAGSTILLRSAMHTTWNAAQKVLKNQVTDLLCHVWAWELYPCAAVFTKRENREFGKISGKLPCNQILTASPYHMKKTGIHLECPESSTDHGRRQGMPWRSGCSKALFALQVMV